MIRTVTLILAVVFFLAAIATAVFITLGVVSGWGWWFPAVGCLVIAVVAGAMTLTGTWIWALVSIDE